MKAILWVLSTFVLAICTFSTDASEGEFKTYIMDLPVELRLDVIERLDFKDLLRVREWLPEDRYVIEKVFKKKFKKQALHISYRNGYPYGELKLNDVPTLHGNLNGELLSFLKYFGHCITKFRFELDGNTDSKSQSFNSLQEQIGKYVAEFVSEIEFHSVPNTEIPFNKLKFSNAKVVKVSQSIGTVYGSIDSATLLRMFPAVRSLELNSVSLTDMYPEWMYRIEGDYPDDEDVRAMVTFLGNAQQLEKASIFNTRPQDNCNRAINELKHIWKVTIVSQQCFFTRR